MFEMDKVVGAAVREIGILSLDSPQEVVEAIGGVFGLSEAEVQSALTVVRGFLSSPSGEGDESESDDGETDEGDADRRPPGGSTQNGSDGGIDTSSETFAFALAMAGLVS